MESAGCRLFFNPSSSHSNMLFLGNCSDSLFSGTKPVAKKRPFFCSPEDYFDDEYYDEQLTEKKRRLSPLQVNLLEKSFEAENKLETERKTELANKLGLHPRQVAVWFQNRRARWKTKQLERDYDLLKSSYESLLSNYESILGEHHMLKSEVASLAEKLQTKEIAVAKEPETLQVDKTTVSPIQLSAKVEDWLSSGTSGSGVVDVDSPQLVDSGNSFFQNDNDYAVCTIPGDCIQLEDNDGSNDVRSYLPDVFVEAGQQQHEVEEPLGWWMWS